MFISTFHSHSRYDDGRGELREYAERAAAMGMKCFGFSGHAPVAFQTDWNMKLSDLDRYVRETKQLKEEFSDRIELYTGLETDFYDACVDWRLRSGMEFTIGSVHFLKNQETGIYMPVDGNAQEFRETLNEGFDGDIETFGEAYFHQVREMLMTMPPNIVGHLDVFRKNNAGDRFFDEEDEWYRDQIMNTLDVISVTDVIVEVNTGGISRGYVTEPYPSRWILEACHELNIPIMLNSDTHAPDTLACHYDESLDMLREIGFRTQRVLLGGQWQDVPLG